MTLQRRTFLQFAAAGALSLSRRATAQAYPSRPITVIVPLAAGGSADVLGRVLAERMRGLLGQSIIIENVSGADGNIGVGRAVRAKPDGYTLILGTSGTHVLNGAFYSLSYDVLNDFEPVAPLAFFPFVLYARKTMPAQNANELVAWLKANPKGASAGIATTATHLLTAVFQKVTGTQLTLVPYRGSAPEIQDLAAGQIDLGFQPPDNLPLVRGGSIKAYAVTSETRSLAADIPTFAELGLPQLSFSGWQGLFAPRGTPGEVVGKLNAALVEAMADPAVQSRLVALGMEAFPHERQTPEALGALVKADAEKWWPIIKGFGIKRE
jgi:tripartite-type tricarboxylate transporter receptor subunit TctC